MRKEYKYMVCTRCFTYNHAPYIVDAMNGFTMQETTFPVVTLIVDDASTDGEPEVIRQYLIEHFQEPFRIEETEYAHIICANHKINPNCQFVVFLLKYNHYSIKKSKLPYLSEWLDNAKYHALCEGDDYWIHPKKLQMQYDFMDNHPEYVLCHTDFNVHGGGYRNHDVYVSNDDIYFPYCLYVGLKIGTLTTFIRAIVYDKLSKCWIGKGWLMGDKPLWIELSHEGKIKYMPIITANYRMSFNSASHSSLECDINGLICGVEINNFYAEMYNVDLPNKGYGPLFFISVMKTVFRHRDQKEAHKYLEIARERRMTSLKLYFLYYATICKPLGELVSKVLKGYYIPSKIVQ